MKLAAALGKMIVGMATLILVLGLILFALGSYLTTLPLMRLTARGRKMQATSALFVSLFTLARAFAPGDADPDA